jgi:HSP90 family molecular chaperone
MMMKETIVLMTAVVLATIGWPAIAAETDAQDQASQEQASPMMEGMHEQMHALQQQMAKIHATDDMDERHRLTHAHMINMRDAMAMMMEMHGEDSQSMAGEMPCSRMATMQNRHHDMQENGGMMQGGTEHMKEHPNMQEAPSE